MKSWIAGAVLAVAGCAAPQGQLAQGPAIASPSDTNVFPAGTLGSSASEISKNQSDIPALNGNGTTGPTARR
jgi:hypothetical protein